MAKVSKFTVGSPVAGDQIQLDVHYTDSDGFHLKTYPPEWDIVQGWSPKNYLTKAALEEAATKTWRAANDAAETWTKVIAYRFYASHLTRFEMIDDRRETVIPDKFENPLQRMDGYGYVIEFYCLWQKNWGNRTDYFERNPGWEINEDGIRKSPYPHGYPWQQSARKWEFIPWTEVAEDFFNEILERTKKITKQLSAFLSADDLPLAIEQLKAPLLNDGTN